MNRVWQSLMLTAAMLLRSELGHAQAYTDTIIHSFAGQPDGTNPDAGLVAGSTGDLYGTTVSGGTYGMGAVFQIDKTGNESILYSFTGSLDGASPGVLVNGNAGELYGTTSAGGAFGFGTVFRVDTSGNETVLYSFGGGADGWQPNGKLAQDRAGNLYGMTGAGGASGYGTVFKLAADGTETILHSFSGIPDGSSPSGGLVADSAGNLYGTTYVGGPYVGCGIQAAGCGIVFKISSTGKETILHSFSNPNSPLDGYQPLGGLIRDDAGNLYGTTEAGGADGLYGTVYKLSPTGVETILYSFYGDIDGELPYSGVIRDSAGNLYGTTEMGGNKGPCYGGFFYSGCGTVFKISPDGHETLLLRFNGPDGESPFGSLVRDAAGKIYGTAAGGGSQACSHYGCGVVFELSRQ